ncbi:RHG32 protein, partial [Asarcornis scutulata]|nr:RHG32 protein [Asarcornis scutulata]
AQLTNDTCSLVPQVIKSCTEFIEKYGIVDGIYRVSGVASNIQKLRHEFDSEQIPDLTKETYIHDIHSVSSLCKLYFRELPNPLLTYHLYDKFS